MTAQDDKVTGGDDEGTAVFAADTTALQQNEATYHVESVNHVSDVRLPKSAPSSATLSKELQPDEEVVVAFPEFTSPSLRPDESGEMRKGTRFDTPSVSFATPSTVRNPPRAFAKDAWAKLPEDAGVLEQWQGHDSFIQSCAYALVHSWRQFGYLPWLALALKKYPRQVIMSTVAYYSLRLNTKWWNDSVHKFLKYAAGSNPTILRANKERYDKNKAYMLTMHPHGMLAGGWWSLLSRYCHDDVDGSSLIRCCGLMDDIEAYLCFAPCVKYMPFHGEMYQSKGTDASASTLRNILQVKKKSVAIVPGGFSEGVYTNYKPNEEVAFILGRYGFIKVAIESQVDIVPVYTFGLNQMYSTLDIGRHQRSVWSQKLSLPLMMYWGKAGSSVPYHEDTVTVSFDPFPTSSYTLDQVKEAHRDYCVYLKKCFDEYKFVTESSKNNELLFAGRTQTPARL